MACLQMYQLTRLCSCWLQILVLDDYLTITELTLRQAYIEAVYWEDEWEYERLTQRYWEHLIYRVSEAGNIDYLLEKHPMHASM
jgi:hypothetical protein